MTKARDELRENIRTVLFKAAGGVTGMADTETDQILSQVDTYVRGIVGEISPTLNHRVHVLVCKTLGLDDEDHEDDEVAEPLERQILKILQGYDDTIRAEQRNRAGLEEDKDSA